MLLVAYCLICIIMSGSVTAHAVVTSSSLDKNLVIANQPTSVELNFNVKIEINLSQISLVSSGDKKQLLEAHRGDSPAQIILLLPPLDLGEYALLLKIFAADGHLSEDLIRFIVVNKPGR